MKKMLLALIAVALLAGCQTTSSSPTPTAIVTAPKSVIHVVTVTWKEGTTPEQITAALEGAKALPAAYKGITKVWTKTIKAQGERTHAIVMEFKDEQALKDYSESAAQKEWYKVYTTIRGRSTTFDITN